MERYNVRILASDDKEGLKLLIPLHHSLQVSALLNEIMRRYAKYAASPLHHILPTLRLNNANGPIVDLDDPLKDVIIDSKTEVIIATSSTLPEPQTDQETNGKVRSVVICRCNSGPRTNRFTARKPHSAYIPTLMSRELYPPPTHLRMAFRSVSSLRPWRGHNLTLITFHSGRMART